MILILMLLYWLLSAISSSHYEKCCILFFIIFKFHMYYFFTFFSITPGFRGQISLSVRAHSGTSENKVTGKKAIFLIVFFILSLFFVFSVIILFFITIGTAYLQRFFYSFSWQAHPNLFPFGPTLMLKMNIKIYLN